MNNKWWALADKRGNVMLSAILGTPMLFRTKREAETFAEGGRFLLPAPGGTKAVRVTVGKETSK